MADEQLALFEPDAPVKRPFTVVQICHLCGEPVSAIPVGDVGDPWNQAVLFSYCAQKQHERVVHPERAA